MEGEEQTPLHRTEKQAEFAQHARQEDLLARRTRAKSRQRRLIIWARELRAVRAVPTLAAIFTVVVVLGVVIRFAQPRTVLGWTNLAALTAALTVWFLWLRGGRGRLALKRRGRLTLKRRKAPTAGKRKRPRSRLLRGRSGPDGGPAFARSVLVGFPTLLVLEIVLSASSFPPGGHTDFELWFVVLTPIVLTALFIDSFGDLGRSERLLACERAEGAVVRVTAMLRKNREHGAPDPAAMVQEHPYFQSVGSRTIGADAGLQHLRRLREHDEEDDRREAARLLLGWLKRRAARREVLDVQVDQSEPDATGTLPDV